MKLEKIYLLFFYILCVFFFNDGFSQGKYVNFSVNGSYQKIYADYSLTKRTVLGGDIAIPLNEYLDLSLSHSLYVNEENYNDAYKEYIKQKYELSDSILPDKLVKKDQVIDTSINIGVGFLIGYVKPSFFGGKLWRRICNEDTFEDKGCYEESTWNAGIITSIAITQSLRFKITYRVSPAAVEDNTKKFDDLISLGITWGL